MVQATHIGVTDVHPGALADGFEAFEFVDLCGAVFLRLVDVHRLVEFFRFWFVLCVVV